MGKVENMAQVMTFESIKESCVANGGYRTPCLNDKLYLHFKGYTRIENLEEFNAARCIWLEANGLQVIENLEPCKESLKQLFLQQNCIKNIGTGLSELTELVALNLSENLIKKVEGISNLKKLSSLQLAQNQMVDYDDLAELAECSSISSLELNKCKIEDPRVIDIFAAMPALKVLKLDGNPITRKVPHYRKALICRLKNLTYLDDRPVFPDERLMAEAWGRGGVEAEKLERTRQRKLKEELDRNRHKDFFKYIERARKERKQKDPNSSDKGWKPVDSSKNDSDSSGATGADRKERETIVRYDVHDKSNDTELDATESWALPRRERKECVIQEVGGQAEAAVKAGSSTRRSREEKRASRQARLKKCIAMVDGDKDAVGSAVPSDALESCGESDVVKSE